MISSAFPPLLHMPCDCSKELSKGQCCPESKSRADELLHSQHLLPFGSTSLKPYLKPEQLMQIKMRRKSRSRKRSSKTGRRGEKGQM